MFLLLTSACVSGLAIALAFPTLGLWPVSVIALVPYLTVLILEREQFKWWQVFLSALLFCAIWNIALLWWLSYVSFLAMVSLTLFIAFLFAVTLTAGWRLTVKGVHPCLVFAAV